MRTDYRADQIMGRLHVCYPIAQRFIDGIFQSLRPMIYGSHFGAKQLHAADIEPLAFHIFGSHVDNTAQSELCANSRRGYAVLPRPGLGNNPSFPEMFCKQRLSNTVVDFMRAGMA